MEATKISDKFRKTIPIKITFGSGEQPSSGKLNAVTNQIRQGNALLEKAVGDPWNQSGDSLLNATPLQIPNISRYVGENKYLNPVLFVNSTFEFRDKLDDYIGETEGFLNFKPVGTTLTEETGSSTFTTLVGDEYLVSGSDQYHLDNTTGHFRTNEPLLGTEVVSYSVDPDEDWFIGEEVLPGVIPDPRQTEFTGVRVSGSDPFFIHLPPRRPITFSATGNSHGSDYSRPDKYPSASELGTLTFSTTNEAIVKIGDGLAGEPGNTELLMFQASTVSGLDAEHYRYLPPKEILDGSFAAGDQFPSGFMYLWDETNKTIIDDVVFKKPSDGNTRKWVIEVSSATFNFAAIASSDETETDYSNTPLSLITCGAPISRSVWQSISAFLNHKHDNSGSTLDANLSHTNLLDQNPPVDQSGTLHFGRYPTYLPSWLASRWTNDPHTSLLSRAGSHPASDAARRRENFNNAMLGNLLIANADTSGADNFIDTTLPDDSFKIMFGDSDGPFIRGTNQQTIEIDHTQGSGSALTLNIGLSNGGQVSIGTTAATSQTVKITSLFNNIGLDVTSAGTGAGINSTAGDTGHAIIVTADSTTPVSSALAISPQDTDPSSASQGDTYINSTSGGMSTYDGTQWRKIGGLAHVVVADEARSTTGVFTGSQFTIPANTLRVGQVIKTRAAYKVTTYSSGSIIAAIGFNGGAPSGTVSRASALNELAYVEMEITVRTIGASGSLVFSSIGTFSAAGADGETTAFTGTFTHDTTGALIIEPRTTISISATLTLRSFTVEICG